MSRLVANQKYILTLCNYVLTTAECRSERSSRLDCHDFYPYAPRWSRWWTLLSLYSTKVQPILFAGALIFWRRVGAQGIIQIIIGSWRLETVSLMSLNDDCSTGAYNLQSSSLFISACESARLSSWTRYWIRKSRKLLRPWNFDYPRPTAGGVTTTWNSWYAIFTISPEIVFN